MCCLDKLTRAQIGNIDKNKRKMQDTSFEIPTEKQMAQRSKLTPRFPNERYNMNNGFKTNNDQIERITVELEKRREEIKKTMRSASKSKR